MYVKFRCRDIPGQAVALVERMKCDKNINFEEDWKMITLFIGGNDLCDYCDDKVRVHRDQAME